MCKIEVKSDFDGYFEGIAKRLLDMAKEAGGPKRAKTIVVTAGPYRSYDWDATFIDQDTLKLDFYSAVRNGFGWINEADMREVAAKM